jgi:hypothetical protein
VQPAGEVAREVFVTYCGTEEDEAAVVQ